VSLDQRIKVGAKLDWCKNTRGIGSPDEDEVISIEDDSFTVCWTDGWKQTGYTNDDLTENGGHVSFKETVDV
jgi:hypothetical protein